MDIRDKIRNKTAQVAIIGLGYVGLPLAVLFAQKGFRVMGIDNDPVKIGLLRQGRSYIRDVDEKELAPLVARGQLAATASDEELAEADVIIICVPTPLNEAREPDITLLRIALGTSARHLRPGQLVILESTSYPGTTEEIALPLLEQTGLQAGSGFFLAYSPERVDPGNLSYSIENIPKVVSGFTPLCREIAALLYSQVVSQVVEVSSPKVAEMTKLLENTFRSVNIALVNELAMVAHQLDIDIWEVIKAAGTKPFGFMPFYPGPGVGGHCLPVDPIYLAWKAKSQNIYPKLVELASQINCHMPGYVVDRVAGLLNRSCRPVKGAKILLLGVTYKRDVEDIRESPALEIISLLLKKEALVFFHDPYVVRLKVSDKQLDRVALTSEVVAGQDLVVIVTDHSFYDYTWLAENARLIFDTRCAAPPAWDAVVKL
ncbi:MAG: nucleotide sugar dehydrogenase [Syntrophomonadaceae bacterium]|nr:nucleotide sugar dehydrogenase [Syntrophomonadaceae bacterium]